MGTDRLPSPPEGGEHLDGLTLLSDHDAGVDGIGRRCPDEVDVDGTKRPVDQGIALHASWCEVTGDHDIASTRLLTDVDEHLAWIATSNDQA